MTIFTIGHSVHEPEAFLKIARGLDVIVDVRSHPTSRWPQWRLEEMRRWLPGAGIAVEWAPGLGGWTARHHVEWGASMAAVDVDLAAYSKGAFPKQRIGVDRPGSGEAGPSWTNQGLYDYAWYTTLPEFRAALDALVDEYAAPGEPRAAIMCSEALWWKCHRSMVADALWAIHGVDSLHIKPRAPVRPTTPRWDRHAGAVAARLERYPGPVREAWRATRAATA